LRSNTPANENTGCCFCSPSASQALAGVADAARGSLASSESEEEEPSSPLTGVADTARGSPASSESEEEEEQRRLPFIPTTPPITATHSSLSFSFLTVDLDILVAYLFLAACVLHLPSTLFSSQILFRYFQVASSERSCKMDDGEKWLRQNSFVITVMAGLNALHVFLISCLVGLQEATIPLLEQSDVDRFMSHLPPWVKKATMQRYTSHLLKP
jgi:hypothetical protein